MRSVAPPTADRAGAQRPAGVRPKLVVGSAGDPLEQEADRAAALAAPGGRVHAAAAPLSVVSRVAAASGRTGMS
jgi:hypothetical protein